MAKRIHAATSKLAAAIFIIALFLLFYIAGTTGFSLARTAVLPVQGEEAANDWELENARTTLENDQNNYENRSSELKNNFRNSDADLSSLNASMSRWNELLGQMAAAVSAGDVETFNDLNSQEDDLSVEINDEFTKGYNLQSLANAVQQANKDKPREVKDLERQLKEFKRNAKKTTINTTQLDAWFTELNTHLTEMQALAASKVTPEMDYADVQDLADSINDHINDFNDVGNEFRNTINDLNEEVNNQNQLVNHQKNLKDKKRTIDEYERDLKRFTKDSPENVAEFEQALNVLKDWYAQIEKAIAESDYDTLNYIDQDFWSANNDVNDVRNSLNEAVNTQQQQKDFERIAKEKDRQMKDMRRECKRVKCESGEAFPVLTELENLLVKMQEVATSGDMEGDFWNLNSEFDTLNRDYWDLVNQQSMTKDLGRWLKDISREVKDKGRWVADLEREAKHGETPFGPEEVAALQEIYEKMVDAAGRAKKAWESGNTVDAQDILNMEFNELRSEFDSMTQGFQTRREDDFTRFEVENMSREIENAKLGIENAIDDGRIDDTTADLCRGYIGEAEDLLGKMKQLIEKGEIGENEEIMVRFEKLGNDADRDCGHIFGGDKGNHEVYVDYFIEEDLQDLADKVFERVSSQLLEKMMSNYQANLNAMLERAGQKWEADLQNFIESSMAVYNITAEGSIESFIAQKTSLLEQIDELEQKISEKSAEFEELQKTLASYNFYGDAGEDVVSELEDLVADADGLSASEQARRIGELKRRANEAREHSREEKFNDGVIPFRDTDDDQWFTQYVASLSGGGFIGGYKDSSGIPTGNFGPGDMVTVAQTLRMALEVSGRGGAEGETSIRQANEGHWAKSYVKRAEELSLNVVQGLQNVDRPATRSEVVRAILEIAGVQPENYESTFSDVPSNHPDHDFVEAARELGIVSGDASKNTFRPNDTVNRAEVSRIITSAQGVLFLNE